MTHPYDTLTPVTVLDMIEALGFELQGEPFALNSYENRVYAWRAESGSRFVLKVYRPGRWTAQQIDEELSFLDWLEQHQVPAGRVWTSPEGVRRHEFKGFHYALFHAVPGQAPELDNPAHLFALGELMGRMHAAAADFSFVHRPTLEPMPLLERSREQVLLCGRLDKGQRRTYERLTSELLTQAEQWSLSGLRLLPTHGDCHIGNLLGRDDEFSLVDFDDAITAPAINDLWMWLSGEDAQQWQRQWSEIIEGYEQYRAFDSRELEWIERLRTLRLVRHTAWIIERWNDPAFPSAFSWLERPGYWETHLRTLEQQRHALSSPHWLA
ncbi:serine/threonine protein kinase [Larsenimonas rhizosphaerae]|uniref:serine/threonine protein kinase n=1 Tax=Larsenimonas rhizosphaerae TaxID=2944682 RepID=UPI00203465A9|nr:serine/threonine protein kinase [Larsenimonas rhizosphaerae]MCM2130771.1 serine/threonine protein kinase [Larsenimonas rhizosphaerae]